MSSDLERLVRIFEVAAYEARTNMYGRHHRDEARDNNKRRS